MKTSEKAKQRFARLTMKEWDEHNHKWRQIPYILCIQCPGCLQIVIWSLQDILVISKKYFLFFFQNSKGENHQTFATNIQKNTMTLSLTAVVNIFPIPKRGALIQILFIVSRSFLNKSDHRIYMFLKKGMMRWNFFTDKKTIGTYLFKFCSNLFWTSHCGLVILKSTLYWSSSSLSSLKPSPSMTSSSRRGMVETAFRAGGWSKTAFINAEFLEGNHNVIP